MQMFHVRTVSQTQMEDNRVPMFFHPIARTCPIHELAARVIEARIQSERIRDKCFGRAW
jgi:hypothetical protein